ncbi:hypothetical protein [Hyalangium versicolor]|uniref:hypothetical protein n=1 Tax=Hyalangium versicolor TaxID=2861190 RepID=UPI001CCC6A1F|nr:hypothetical protein [Hyalangium versicolor]
MLTTLAVTLSVLLSADTANADPCNGHVEVHRAWRFHGGSTIEPSPQAELVAIDFTHRDLSRIYADLRDDQDKPLRTDFHWVRLDAKGAPLDRFFESYGDETLTRRMALVAAVPKGTQKLTLVIRDVCSVPVTLQDKGPEWPPLPEHSLLWWTIQGDDAIALVRTRWVLDGEDPSFRVRRGNGYLNSAGFVAVDSKGQRLAPGSSKERFFLIRYSLVEWKRKVPEPPDEWPCNEKWCPLPAPVKKTLSEELMRALVRSEGVAIESGDDAQRAFALHPKP